MLHYMPYEEQTRLMERCMNNLLPGGKIIIRDGNSSDTEHHKVTKLTEVLSTRVFCFNKTEGNLYFTSWERIQDICRQNGFDVTRQNNDNTTSNEIFVIERSVK